MRGALRWPALAGVGALAVALTACAAPAAEGPADYWREEILAAAGQANSELEQAVLEDGRITDQEYAELQSRIISCLRGVGVEGKFDADGSLSYTSSTEGDIPRDAIEDCNAENGIRTIALRDAMIRNPENLDEATIMVACLRRAGLIDESYRPDDYRRGTDLVSISASSEFDRCNSDPLGYGK